MTDTNLIGADTNHDEDVRLVRDTMLTPDERVAMWKVARGLGRTKDEEVLLNALYHDHADCAAGRGMSPLLDALMEEHKAAAAIVANVVPRDSCVEGCVYCAHRAAHDKVEGLL